MVVLDEADFGNYGVKLCPSDIYQLFWILWDSSGMFHIFRLRMLVSEIESFYGISTLWKF